jgi:hypothetical protein
MRTKVWLENLKGGDLSENHYADRIILKLILRKEGGKV